MIGDRHIGRQDYAPPGRVDTAPITVKGDTVAMRGTDSPHLAGEQFTRGVDPDVHVARAHLGPRLIRHDLEHARVSILRVDCRFHLLVIGDVSRGTRR